MQLQTVLGLLLIRSLSVCGHVVDDVVVKRAAVPAPIVLAASQDWDGNDGPWSSFTLQVGTPPQVVKVFPSTSSYQTLVVLPEGCISSDPSDCAQLRGGEFLANESSTWLKNTASSTSDIYPLLVGRYLGYDSKAKLGFDSVTLGWEGAGGPMLENQTVGGFAAKDSYLGLFGLTPRASNFTDFSDPVPSYLQNLKAQSIIPSTSWAYTAGNQYRLNSVLGSLTLGGYDKNKLVPNEVTWQFDSEDKSDLTVQINSITSDGPSPRKLLPKSIPAFLDSGLPYIWLPEEACALFEEAFNLTWNNQSQLYLLDDSQHEALLAQNPNITITIGNLTAGANVDIKLPYAAFDLMADLPLANKTRYFPLKRAANSTQYTLGRTFFQEAYVIADYDRRNFSVSACNWEPTTQQDIVTIWAPELASGGSGFGSSNGNLSNGGGPAGAIAGGVVGGIAGIALVGFLVYYFCFKPRERSTEAAAALGVETQPSHASTPEDLAKDKVEMDNQDYDRVHEMEGKKNQWVVEADSQQRNIHEMPAREEVAVEMLGFGNAAEMETRGNAAEMESPPNPENRRFSWEETPIDAIRSQPPPRWSWATTPGGATPIDGGKAEDEGIVSPPSTIREEEPQSPPSQLVRSP